VIGGFQAKVFQPDFQQIRATLDAGRPRRFRAIYRITIDGEVFECRTLAEAIDLLNQAKALAAKLVQQQVRDEKPIARIPKIETNTRELRAVVTETKREVAKIYEQAAIDAELMQLFAVQLREEHNQDALLLLM
jgi:hypothetical protein